MGRDRCVMTAGPSKKLSTLTFTRQKHAIDVSAIRIFLTAAMLRQQFRTRWELWRPSSLALNTAAGVTRKPTASELGKTRQRGAVSEMNPVRKDIDHTTQWLPQRVYGKRVHAGVNEGYVCTTCCGFLKLNSGQPIPRENLHHSSLLHHLPFPRQHGCLCAQHPDRQPDTFAPNIRWQVTFTPTAWPTKGPTSALSPATQPIDRGMQIRQRSRSKGESGNN
jgi:hypothetical protein